MIRICADADFETVCSIINDGARIYRGVIPPDCWHEPYMSGDELRAEMANGVRFWGWEERGSLEGVMAMQELPDVTLIRHAYVRSDRQKQGIGSALLTHLRARARRPVLIGTWEDAVWAIRFYQKHGFHVIPHEAKEQVLQKYWSIPRRQSEVSVVLADSTWPGYK